MRTSEERVLEFHKALGHPIAAKPGPISAERLALRMTLIAEEVTELLCAMTGQSQGREEMYQHEMLCMVKHMMAHKREPDLVGIADGACDSHVVISGTCIEFGIPEDACYEEVHRSNMAKKGGPIRADGKSLKPEGWKPPDLEGVLNGALEGFGCHRLSGAPDFFNIHAIVPKETPCG